MGKGGFLVFYLIVFSMILGIPNQVQGQTSAEQFTCPDGLMYDTDKQRCISEQIVSGCGYGEYDESFGGCRGDYGEVSSQWSCSCTAIWPFCDSQCRETVYFGCKDGVKQKVGTEKTECVISPRLSPPNTSDKTFDGDPHYGWIDESGNVNYSICGQNDLVGNKCVQRETDGGKFYCPEGFEWDSYTKIISKDGLLEEVDYCKQSDPCPHPSKLNIFGHCEQKPLCPNETNLNVFGNCEASFSRECPEGTKVNAFGNCEATPTCEKGTLNAFGDCERKPSCPSGSVAVLGTCEKKADCDEKKLGVCVKYSCDSGWKRTVAICSKAPTCPSDMRMKGTVCVMEPTCPSYLEINSVNRCIGDAKKECPSGTALNDFNVCIGDATCWVDWNYNQETLTCLHDRECQKGAEFDEKRNACIGGPIQKCSGEFNYETGQCVYEENPTCDEGFVKEGIFCVSKFSVCPENSRFNSQTNSCESQPICPGDLVFFDGECVDGQTIDQEDLHNNIFTIQKDIPYWIRNLANWWSQDQISDSEFLSAISYMIEKQVINIENLPSSSDVRQNEIPSWVKLVAGEWANQNLSDEEFSHTIKFLVEKGIIHIQN